MNLAEYAEIVDIWLDALEKHKAQYESPEEQERLLQVTGNFKSLEDRSKAGDASAIAEVTAMGLEMQKILATQSERMYRSYSLDAPFLVAFLKIVDMLNTNKNAPPLEPAMCPPWLTQMEPVQKLVDNFRNPLVRGAVGVPAENGSGNLATMKA